MRTSRGNIRSDSWNWPSCRPTHLGVRALFRKDHVEVVADVVGERRARQQFQEIGGLEVEARVGSDLAADRIDGFGVTCLHESLHASCQRQRFRERQRFVPGLHRMVAPVGQAEIHLTGKAFTEVVEARIGGMADVAADAIVPRKGRHRACRVVERENPGDQK
jgi:hypothetical protein